MRTAPHPPKLTTCLIAVVLALLVLPAAAGAAAASPRTRDVIVDPSTPPSAEQVAGHFSDYEWWLGVNADQSAYSVHAAEAWGTVDPSRKVVVADVDGGVNYNEPALANSLWTNPSDPIDGVDNDHNGYADDLHGANIVYHGKQPLDSPDLHGTTGSLMMAGASADNNQLTGVSRNVLIQAVKFMTADSGTNSAEAKGIRYAVRNGARVINASFGGVGPSTVERKAIRYAQARGVWIVAAAGNESLNQDTRSAAKRNYPSGYKYPNVISVAASDEFGHLSMFSNYGRKTVDLAAPGQDVLAFQLDYDGSYTSQYVDGTSFSAPLVSAAVATYIAKWGRTSYGKLRAALAASVTRTPDLATKTKYGGVLNVAAFLNTHY